MKTKISVILFFFALLTGASSANAANLWPSAVDMGGGEKYSYWFENFNDGAFPWIYHYQHGWLYCVGDGGGGIWFYDLKFGWIWTNGSTYPYFYFPDKGWVWYQKGGTPGNRWFSQMSNGAWFSDKPAGHFFDPRQSAEGDIYWKYLVNKNEPVNLDPDGNMTQKYDKFEEWYRPNDKQQTLEYQITYGGLQTGHMTAQSVSTLAFIDGKTYTTETVSDSTDTREMNLGAAVMSTLSTSHSHTTYTAPGQEWYMGNLDLWNKPDGYVYEDPNPTQGHVVSTTYSAQTYTPPIMDPIITGPNTIEKDFTDTESWKILEHVDSMIVLDKTYNNILVITYNKPLENDQPPEEIMRYWEAEGIGMIKGEENFGSGDTAYQLLFELQDTNLKQ